MENIGSKWVVLDAQQQAAANQILHNHKNSHPIYTQTSQGPSRAVIAPATRYPILMAEFRSVAQLGSLNMKNLVYVQDTIAELIRVLSMGPITTEEPKQRVRQLNTDEKKFTELLGTTLEVMPVGEATILIEQGLPADTTVLVKYGKLRSGGWFSGLAVPKEDVANVELDVCMEGSTKINGITYESNFFVAYDGENKHDLWYLGTENYTTNGNASKGYWSIVRDRKAGASAAEIATMTLPVSKPLGGKRKKTAAEIAARKGNKGKK